jgi:hypothetical protein
MPGSRQAPDTAPLSARADAEVPAPRADAEVPAPRADAEVPARAPPGFI